MLIPILHEAEEGDERILAAIENASNTAYLAKNGDDTVGAVIMCWGHTESEIIYIATTPQVRGQGYGKAIIHWLINEAQRRGVAEIWVGTANAGLDNIAFYQKCGFRMDSVRKDYFDYFLTPVYKNGIRIRDMLMLKLVVVDVINDAAHP